MEAYKFHMAPCSTFAQNVAAGCIDPAHSQVAEAGVPAELKYAWLVINLETGHTKKVLRSGGDREHFAVGGHSALTLTPLNTFGMH